MRKFFIYWLPVIIWMGVIFLFSSRQRVEVSEDTAINFIFFKTLHILEYAFLMILSLRAVDNIYGKKKIWIAFILCLFFAVSDEIHQTFVPTREGRLRDVIIDLGGMTLSWISIVNVLPKAPKRLKRLAGSFQIHS
jgi:VanZ family protein